MPASEEEAPPGEPTSQQRPLVASLVGTFLKPEMLSVYRQITGLRAYRTLVLTERRVHAEGFPFEPVVTMERAEPPPPRARMFRGPATPKPPRRRPRGNFVRRFYYKHLLGVWPPPIKAAPLASAALPSDTLVPDQPSPPFDPRPDPYNLLPLLAVHRPALLHVYYGHKAVKFLPLLLRWPGPTVVSFHGLDAADAAYPKFPGGAAEALPGVFTRADLVLARSESLLARLVDLGCPRGKLRLSRAGIPLDRLPRVLRAPPPDGRWRLLQACRLIEKKGLRTTLLAFQEILRVWPAARLVLAGDGPLAVTLRGLAAELGIAEHVEFAGWCSQERLRTLYLDSHLFLHPSEGTPGGDREGVPNSLLEAMATGLPVVATTHGGIPEAVRAGTDGLLVPEREPGQLAGAALQLLGDPTLFTAFSAQASTGVRDRYGSERQVASLERCYEEAIQAASPPSETGG